jgi:NAD(P)-dependent dehydrogenase (short-subunit alcohol dehydrogenase family)
MRCLRRWLPKTFINVDGGIRVNAISPSMTDTRMVDSIRETWNKAGNPVNTADDVAKFIVGCARAGRGSQAIWYDGKEAKGVRKMDNLGDMDWDKDELEARGMSGRNWTIVGGEAWDGEEGLDRTRGLWLGESVSVSLAKGQVALGAGGAWK